MPENNPYRIRNAVGWWGNDINQRVDQEQIPEKVRLLLSQKLLARGKDIFLWQQVSDSTPNVLACSCVKETADRPDNACNSCYGTKLIPGYALFSHETLYLSSISPLATKVNVQLNTFIKPHRIELTSAALNGSFTSLRIQFVNPLNRDWEFKGNAVTIIESNASDFSFSTDGVEFHPIEQINDPDKKPVGVGGIYLRVSLARQTLTDRSPVFEIMRVRHASKTKPHIKVLRPWVQDLPILMQYGRRNEDQSVRFWTAPLDFFDPTIPRDTAAARVTENSFYSRITGINRDVRYTMGQFDWNEEFGIFTHQSFTARKTQPEELYSALVF